MTPHPSSRLVAHFGKRFEDQLPNLYDQNYDTVLFDADGPLFNNEPWIAALDELDIHGFCWDLVREQILKIKKEQGWLNSRAIFEKCNLEAREQGAFIDYDYFLHKMEKKSLEPGNPLGQILHRDTLQTLEALALSGVQLAIVTNEDRKATDIKLKMTGLKDFFREYKIRMFTPEDVGRGKPHPEIILHALEELGTDPRRALMVGDRDTDVLACEAASPELDTLLIERSYWPSRKTLPTYYIKNHLQTVYTIAAPSIIREDYLGSAANREDKTFLEAGIADVLKHYPEGSLFFHHMDGYIKNNFRIARLVLNIIAQEFPNFDTVIFSGDLGHIWGYAPLPPDRLCVRVVGSLRPEGRTVQSIIDIKGRNCVFADDTLYGGRTLEKVLDFVSEKGGNYLGAVTAYDGSSSEARERLKEAMMEKLGTYHEPVGLWSYFEHFDEMGKPVDNWFETHVQ